jgi:Leucine-rich repeat (LRR) protein
MKRKSNLNTDFDFEAVALSHGYLKARLILKQLTAVSKQKTIDDAGLNDPLLKIRNVLKAKDELKISRTIGLISDEKTVEKILSLTSKEKAHEKTISLIGKRGKGGKYELHPELPSIKDEEVNVDTDMTDMAFHKALISEEGVLNLAQSKLECLPTGIGDTLALQACFLNSMKCSGNNFKYLTSYQLPQLSTYHMRYVREINLSDNKLKTLPHTIGNMNLLHTLNVSNNLLSSLPSSIGQINQLTDLNISFNSFHTLPPEFAKQTSLTRLNLSSNAIAMIPPCIIKLVNLKLLDLSLNHLQHLAVMPLAFMRPMDLWKKILDEENSRYIYINVYK